jgi:hypothetical protein
MLTRTMILAAIICISVNAEAADFTPPRFVQLHRLSTALRNFNNPDPDSKLITTWRQGGGKGVSTTLDSDSSTLREAIQTWADDCKGMDLTNVAIISDGGRRIRFIDYMKHTQKPQPPVKLQRGDIVALMAPIQAK